MLSGNVHASLQSRLYLCLFTEHRLEAQRLSDLSKIPQRVSSRVRIQAMPVWLLPHFCRAAPFEIHFSNTLSLEGTFRSITRAFRTSQTKESIVTESRNNKLWSGLRDKILRAGGITIYRSLLRTPARKL